MSLPADNSCGTASSSTRALSGVACQIPKAPANPKLSGARLLTALWRVPWLAGWGSTLPLLLLGGPSGSGAACCQGLAAALLPVQMQTTQRQACPGQPLPAHSRSCC